MIHRFAFRALWTLSTLSIPIAPQSAAGGADVDAFGRVEACPFGTLKFIADDGLTVALFSVPVNPGDYIRVRGDFNPNIASICDFNTALPQLIADDFELGFAGCGTLDLTGAGPQIALPSGDVLRIADAGGFANGARVFVRGGFAAAPDAGLPPLLENHLITECAEAVGRVETEGPCALVRASDGALIAIENLGGFRPGDFVIVEGVPPPSPGEQGCPAAISGNVVRAGFGGCGVVQTPDACGRNFDAEPIASAVDVVARGLSGGVGADVFLLAATRIDPLTCGALEVDVREQLPCIRIFGDIVGAAGGGWLLAGDDGVDYLLETVAPPPVAARVYVTGAHVAATVAGDPSHIRFARVNAVREEDFFVGVGFECTPLAQSLEDGSLWTLRDFAPPASNRNYRLMGIENAACFEFCPYPCLLVLAAAAPGAISADTNCDGAVSVSDIAPFVLALTDPAAYAAQFPLCDPAAADINRDGVVSVSDIAGFVLILAGER